MAKGYMQEIRERILSAEEGSVFSTSDFADIADTNTVRSALYRLIQDEVLFSQRQKVVLTLAIRN